MIPPDLINTFVHDPFAFIQTCWPNSLLYDKQAEVIQSVVDNPETFVHSANESGKTHSTAKLVIWWFSTRFPARVIVSSSSELQLLNALWPEVTTLIRRSAIPLGINVQHLELSVLNPETDRKFDDHYCRFMTTRNVESFQGSHLPITDGIPRILIAFEEASGVPDIFYEAAQSQAHRILVIGNPLTVEGFFYRHCKGGDTEDQDNEGKLLRKVIHISGDDSPNVKIGKRWKQEGRKGHPPTVIPGVLTWNDYRRRLQIWDIVKQTTRLFGRFFEGAEYLMFPPSWLDQSEDAWEQVIRQKRGPYWMGIDVAQGGGDQTVWTVVDWIGIVDVLTSRTTDAATIGNQTLNLMRKWGIPARHVMFDKGGGGHEHAGYLWAKGYRVRKMAFGAAATDPKVHENRRVEMYDHLRRSMNPAKWTKLAAVDDKGEETGGQEWRRCLAIPNEGHALFSPELREELAILPMEYDAKGKQTLPPKTRSRTSKTNKIKTIEEMIGRSPDRSDSLALAVWCRDGGQKKVQKLDKDYVIAPSPEQLDQISSSNDLKIEDDEKHQATPPRTLADRLFGDPRQVTPVSYW